MYRHLDALFAGQPIHQAAGRGLAISGSGTLAQRLFPHGQLAYADYPEYNMLDLPFKDNHFDFVVSDQVLEHVGGDPFRAVDETFRITKQGGIVVHTTCLLFQIHGYPSDYWRFTPEGLRLLCRSFSRVIDVGGWGNRYLWALNWLGVLYTEKVPLTRWHPFHKIAVMNEERYPVVTWIVAQK
jgi:ubiquinone/menaquinone biosynthesis C-methylase UbiE